MGARRRIKREFCTEEPDVHIGKNGTTPELMKEINRRLNQHKVVKIKILKGALQGKSSKEIASTVSEQVKSVLIEVRGHTFILYRRKKIE